MKHTDTPWEQQSGLMVLRQGHVVCRLYYKTLKKEAAEITFAEAEANAAFIVKACNNHMQLVAALKDIVEKCPEPAIAHEIDMVGIAEKALKKAEVMG